MFKYLLGKITAVTTCLVELENNGIGFEINVSSSNSFKLNENHKVYIYDHISENKIELYGFLLLSELIMFKNLISVNGIGPKKAIQILKNTNSEELIYLISTKDVSKLKKISGIGANAENLILHLAKKINAYENHFVKESSIYDTLISIGYSHKSVSEILEKIPTTLSEEEILKEAIVRLSSNEQA